MAKKSNNPFNTSVFNEVRPTYVGPPVEELSAARQELNTRFDVNEANRNLLNQSFSESIANMQGDDDGVAMIMKYQKDFSNSLAEVTNSSNLAYAGNVIQDNVNAFAGDYKIKGRQKLVDQYNGTIDGVRNNPNLSPHVKKAFIEGYDLNKYATRNDDLGLYDMGEMPLPYEQVDVNKELLTAAKGALGFPDITSWDTLKFRDANNNLSDVYDPNATVAVVDTKSGVTREVAEGRLNTIFEGIINNNDKLRGYLIQESLVSEYNSDPTKNPVDRFSEIYNNPALLSQVVKDASSKLAEGFSYTQQSIDNNLSSLRLQDKVRTSGGEDDTPGPGPVEYRPASPVIQNNKDKETTEANVKSYEQQAKTVLPDPVKSELLNGAVADNNIDEAIRIASEVLGPDKAMEAVNNTRSIQLSKSIADAKLNNANDLALKQAGLNNVTPTATNNGDPRLTTLRDMGYDYRFYDSITEYNGLTSEYETTKQGSSNLDYAMNMVNTIVSERNEARSNATYWQDSANSENNSDRKATAQAKADEYAAQASKLDPAVEVAADFRKEYKNKYKTYQSRIDGILKREDAPIDEMVQQLPQKGEIYKQLKPSFESPANINDQIVYDADNPNEEFTLKDGYSIKVHTIGTSPVKVANSKSGSWVFTATVTDDEGKNPKDYTLRSPVESEAGGISPAGIEQITNSPIYKASKILHEVVSSNIEGRYNLEGYDGFAVVRNTDDKPKKGDNPNDNMGPKEIKYVTPTNPSASSKEFLAELANATTNKTVEGLSYVDGASKYNDLESNLQILYDDQSANATYTDEELPSAIRDNIANSLYGAKFDSIDDDKKQRVDLIINTKVYGS